MGNKRKTAHRWGGIAVSGLLTNLVRTMDVRVGHCNSGITFESGVELGRIGLPSEKNEPYIIVFWHEYILPLLPLAGKGTKLTLLVSRHRDAEWLNQAAAQMGYQMVRGSTARGGTEAIREIKRIAGVASPCLDC